MGKSSAHEPTVVIFDCDGVLVDSEALVTRIESELLLGVGVELSPEEIGDLFVGLTEAEMNRQIEERWGVSLEWSFVVEKERRIALALAHDLEPVVGVSEVLRVLSDRQIRCCVASSSGADRIRASLERTGLATFFGSALFSASMVSRGKPAPDLFLHAAKMMQVAAQACVVVEDSPHGVEAALAAGMDVIGFAAASHCGPRLVQRLKKAGASDVACSASELLELIEVRCDRRLRRTGPT